MTVTLWGSATRNPWIYEAERVLVEKRRDGHFQLRGFDSGRVFEKYPENACKQLMSNGIPWTGPNPRWNVDDDLRMDEGL